MCASLTRLMFVQYSAAGYERVKSSVFNLRLNTGCDEDDEMKVANNSRLVPPQLETYDLQSSSASITECQTPPCLTIKVAVKNLSRLRKWARQTGTVVQYHAGSEKEALPDGTLFSPELATNGGHGETDVILLPIREDQSRSGVCKRGRVYVDHPTNLRIKFL